MARVVRCLVSGLVCICGLMLFFALCGGTPASAEPLGVDELHPSPPSNPNPQTKIPEIEDAVKAFQNRRFDEALKSLQAAVKVHPELHLPPAHILMAQFFAAANQAGGVRIELERAVISDPTDPEAYVILGDFAMQDRRVTEAALLFGKANDLLKTFDKSKERKKILEPRTINGLAQVSEARENWEDAQKYLEAFLIIDTKDTG